METITFENGRVFAELPSCGIGDYTGSGSIGLANMTVLKEKYEWESQDYGECTNPVDFPMEYIRRADYMESSYEYIVPEPETVIIVLHAAYGSESMWMDIAHPDFDDLYHSLNDYAVLDEYVWSQTEQDLKVEDWCSWMQSDFFSLLTKWNESKWDDVNNPEFTEWWDDSDDYKIFAAFEALWDALTPEDQFSVFEQFCNDQNEYIEEHGTEGYSVNFERLDLDDFIKFFVAEVNWLDKSDLNWRKLESEHTTCGVV